MGNYQLITILGPTASGKTTFAAALAERLDTEIISADSRQVYRSMDIGTGKDLTDYWVNGKAIPYHLIDICEPGEKYNVFKYQHDFYRCYDPIRKKGKLPILCGGTGMYIEAVLKGYKLLDVPQNPALRESLKDKSLAELEQILAGYKTLHNKTDVDSAQRAIRAIEIEEYYKHEAPHVNEYEPLNSLIIGIDIIEPEDLIYYGLEYKFLTLYLIGQLSYEDMVTRLEIAIHQFAKRQMTWFRGMEKRGSHIHWLDATLPTETKIEKTLALLESIPTPAD